MRGAIVCVLVALGCAAATARGAELTQTQRVQILSEAQQAYDQAVEMRASNPAAAVRRFRESAERFQLLVDSGIRNGRLYYNLANAYLQSESLGLAIANYRRAERLLPGDGRIEANLKYARSLCRNRIEAAGGREFARTLFFWHYAMPLHQRVYLASALWTALWLLLVLRVFWRRFRWRFALIPCGAVVAMLAASIFYETQVEARQREGVLTADEVIARKGNGEGFEPQFKQALHQGVEFRLLEQRGDWLHIEMADGKDGWVREREAALIEK